MGITDYAQALETPVDVMMEDLDFFEAEKIAADIIEERRQIAAEEAVQEERWQG